jgi:hypothetical protein
MRRTHPVLKFLKGVPQAEAECECVVAIVLAEFVYEMRVVGIEGLFLAAALEGHADELTSLYVCLYACMYVCAYVCMYLCMYI